MFLIVGVIILMCLIRIFNSGNLDLLVDVIFLIVTSSVHYIVGRMVNPNTVYL